MRNPGDCDLDGVRPSCRCCVGVHQVPLGSAVARCEHVPVVHSHHSCIPRPTNTRSFEAAETSGIGRAGNGRTTTHGGDNPREADLMGLTASGWCSRVGRCVDSDSAFIFRPHSAPGPILRVSKPSGTLGIRRRGGAIRKREVPKCENRRKRRM